MSRVDVVIIKGIESVPIGLLCPECDGKLYATLQSTKTGANEPGYCDKCDYVGWKHGGFDIPIVEEFLRSLPEVQE